jgi:hypothetical protein
MIKNKIRIFPMICSFNKTTANKFDILNLFLKKDFIQGMVDNLKNTNNYPRELSIDPDDFLFENIELKKSFPVLLEYYPKDEIYIVDSPELGVYAYGKTREESLNDFKIALEDSYFSLRKNKDDLSFPLMEQWEKLKEIIEEK